MTVRFAAHMDSGFRKRAGEQCCRPLRCGDIGTLHWGSSCRLLVSFAEAACSSPSEENPSHIADRSEDTSSSLLAGLRNEDGEAWSRLVQIWTPLIYGYCRKRGFGPDDAEDIVQTVLVKIFNGFSGFERDGVGKRFRYWVMAIVRNEIADFCRRNSHRPPAVGGSEFHLILQNVSEPESESHSD
jgi:hypothetical protein